MIRFDSSLCLLAFLLFVVSSSGVAFAQEGREPGPSVAGQQCYVNQFKAKIAPERIRSFIMPMDGLLANWISESGKVKKDTILATINEDELELEKKNLEISILKDKTTKKEELSKLEKQREEIEFYEGLSAEERQYATKIPQGGKRVLESIRDKIELIDKELNVLEDQANMEFRKKEEKHVLRMPFDGRLQYQFSFPNDDSTSLYLEASAPIATVCDDSAYYIIISISDPDLTRLPPEALTLSVPMSDGSSLNGEFAFKRVEKNTSSGGDLLAYFFKLAPQDHAKAHDMIGSNCTARLYYTSPDDVMYLNKVRLASLPEGKSCSSWQELLQKVHPEYELILDAETELIVRKK